MLRSLFGLTALFCVCAITLAADDKKDSKDVKADHKTKATITKVDPKAGTVTVKMKDKDGKDVEKTFKLTEDIRYFDSTGKAAAIDVFKSGNDVLVIEREGKLREMHQNAGDKDRTKTPADNTKDKSSTEKKPEKK